MPQPEAMTTLQTRERAPEPERAKPADRGGALSFRIVGGVFLLLLVLGVGLGVTIHRSYVGFERVAARHVPPDATLTVRWDVEKVSLFEPTRRFLLPLFDEGPAAAKTPGPSRRERFTKEGGAMLGRDLREVLATFGPGENDWSLVLAGSFPKGDPIAAAGRTLAAEGHAWRVSGADRLVSPSGVALGKGADGVLVFASSEARLAATLVLRPLVAEIPRIGAASWRVRPAVAGMPHGSEAVLGGLGPVTAIDGEARWGNPMPVEVTLHFPGNPPEDIQARVRGALATLLGEDLERLEKQYAPLAVQPAGNQAVRAELLIDDTGLERAANRAAGAIEHALGFGPAQE